MIIKGAFCNQPKKRGKFINPYLTYETPILDTLKSFFSRQKNVPVQDVPKSFKSAKHPSILHPDFPTARFLGHSTFLIEIDGVFMLTDPHWGKLSRPLRGKSRSHDMPISLDELPSIEYVLISHNHFDHLDSYTVKELSKRFPNITWFIPFGLRKWFEKRGVKNIVQMKWWQHHEVALEGKPELSFRITAVPAQHYSGRTILDRNRSLWCGFVVDSVRNDDYINGHRNFYFSGDTGYNEHDFKAIGEILGKVNLALIPIGNHGKGHSQMHTSPKEAVKIHNDVRADLSVSMHHHTFQDEDLPSNLLPFELDTSLKAANVPSSHFRVLTPGYAINW